MKLARILLFATLIFTLFAAASQTLASSSPDPKKTPGAKATEKAIEHATKQAGKEHGRKNAHFRGQVTSLSAGSLTLALRDGSSVTVGLNAETRLKIPSQKDATLASLQPGMDVMVQARLGVDGTLAARTVMVIPGKPSKIHRVGIVTAYSPGTSITIQDKKGQTYTFVLAAGLKILPAERAAELAVGSRVTVIAPRYPGSSAWTARGIVVHPKTGTP